MNSKKTAAESVWSFLNSPVSVRGKTVLAGLLFLLSLFMVSLIPEDAETVRARARMAEAELLRASVELPRNRPDPCTEEYPCHDASGELPTETAREMTTRLNITWGEPLTLPRPYPNAQPEWQGGQWPTPLPEFVPFSPQGEQDIRALGGGSPSIMVNDTFVRTYFAAPGEDWSGDEATVVAVLMMHPDIQAHVLDGTAEFVEDLQLHGCPVGGDTLIGTFGGYSVCVGLNPYNNGRVTSVALVMSTSDLREQTSARGDS